ncbi:MAG: alanine--tRNA ligase [Lachnospiraceae bacterium]|jgi:alanyl-tRNA synthetase|nr:alanine--tRNA ligase [Lachnospiraceae bacterium]
MEKYGVNQLREMFLKYFESKGCLRMKSFSLVPHNDDSLLIINSGMAPLKPYFTGQEIPPRKRVTTCQKCIRTGDLENVGKTARHGTFFEMLGNFSFGDYFKKEAIPWAWEFLTEVVGLDADRLYPSVYVDDQEAWDLWHDKMGIAPERIFRFGKEDNFWEHGSGPCGPCSEIYYDRGEKYGCGKPGCTVGCECDRYMEVWNIVFSQFNNDGHGNYSDLIQKNIDTGMGLERLAVAVQGVDSIFDVDTLQALRDEVCTISGTKYHTSDKDDVAIRVITDHARSVTFMISDGIMPSNEGRGYVLRRLLRRADRYGKLLGIEGPFMKQLAEAVIEGSKDGYPELEEKKNFILNVVEQEEGKFEKTINQGLGMLTEAEERIRREEGSELSGSDAFRLYDTFGFPLDLTREILAEKDITVDEKGFDAEMKEQKDKARSARKKSNYMGADATVYEQLDAGVNTEFTGYGDHLTETGKVVALCELHTEEEDAENTVAEALSDGMTGAVITDRTPFYGTMGGQVGDIGTIESEGGSFEVRETLHVAGSKIAHIGVMTRGMFRTGDTVTLKVDAQNRMATCRNHSATHLLQKALREVLGTHVEQAGSYQDPQRTRFDFSHFKPMTADEIRRVEDMVNEKITAGLPVTTDVMGLEEARKTGAMALFGEKYGEKVRVVKMGDFSTELCGGTHVSNTSQIGQFKILSESGVAAGVRRIEAITGANVRKYYDGLEKELDEAASLLKATPETLSEHIRKMQEDLKSLRSENESLKSREAREQLGDISDRIKEIAGVRYLGASVDNVDMNGLRELGDQMKAKYNAGVILLLSARDGKVSLMAMASDEAAAKGAHAGNLVKAIAGLVGGGGGGRPNMAQAGGKDPAGIPRALEEAENVLRGQIR